ncbi:MAG: ankyrin repeat domain-containing protein [Akkermansia sp.]|nr:ankyrin repeat domain-containing protein [Akkermansia sp.]
MSDTTINAGRETRAKFWPLFLPYLLLLLLTVSGVYNMLGVVAIPAIIVSMLLLPGYLVIIRKVATGRLHDAGVSAFFYWMLIVAELLAAVVFAVLTGDALSGGSAHEWLTVVFQVLLFGFGVVLHVFLLVFFLLPSQAGTNDYGDNPAFPGVTFTGTSWGGIIEDMLKLLLVMGTLGFLCNLAMKPFEQTSVTDSLVSLIRKGSLETDKKTGEEIDNVYLRELAAGVAADPQFVNTKDATGRTPLMWAVYANYNNPEDALNRDLARLYYVQNLLSCTGIDVQAKDKDGFTAMHWAAWSGMPYCTLLLAEAGLDINAQEGNGFTPLMLAAMRGNNEVVRMLLALGASTELRNVGGQTAAELVANGEGAYSKRDTFIFSLIFSKEREVAYKATLALLTNPPAARNLAELTDDMARMSGEARAERMGAGIIEKDKDSGLTVLLQTVLGAAEAENTQEYDAAIHYFVLGQLKAIAELEAKLAKEGTVVESVLNVKDKEGRNALDIALQFGLTKSAAHLSTVLQPSAPAPDATPAQPDTPVLPTPALDAAPEAPATAEAPAAEELNMDDAPAAYELPTVPAEAPATLDLPAPAPAEQTAELTTVE